MASFLLHNPLTRLVGNLLASGVNFILQFFLFMGLIFVSFGLRPSGRLGQILYDTLGEVAPPYVNDTIQPGLLLLEALSVVIHLIGLVTVMVICASLAMYYRERGVKANAREQLTLVEAMGGDTAAIKQVEDAKLPNFGRLLVRNTLMCVIFLPVPLLIFWGIVNFMAFGVLSLPFLGTLRDHRDLLEALLKLGIFAALGFIGLWFTITKRIVDKHLLKSGLGMSEEGSATDFSTALGGYDLDDANHDASFGGWFVRGARTFVGQIMMLVRTMLPIFLLIGALTVVVDLLNLPSIVFGLGSILILGGALYRSMTVGLEKPTQELYQTIETELTKEYGADSDEVREFKESVKGQETSTESHMMRYALIFMFVAFGLIFGAAIIAAELTTAAGGSLDDRKNTATVVLGIGTLLLFGGMFVMGRFMPSSPGLKLVESATAAMMRMDYPEMLRLTEQFLSEVPNWESKSWAAIAYMAVRRFEDAERCIHEVLETIASMPDDQRKMMKSVAGTMRGILASLRAVQGRYAEAEESIRMAITLDPDEPAHYNTLAEILMLQGRSADEAWGTLEQAGQMYRKAKRESSPTHHALRAWAWALRGDSNESDDEMLEAVTSVKQEEQVFLPEVYLTGARASLALGKVKAARTSLKRAADMDPTGLNGVQAADLLATLI